MDANFDSFLRYAGGILRRAQICRENDNRDVDGIDAIRIQLSTTYR